MGIPIIGGIIDAVGSVLGGAIDAISGTTSAKMSRDAYQHRYQDTVRDMRKAGLNPALAYGQNPGAGAPNQTLPEIGTSTMRGLTAAANARQAAASADLTGAQAALLKMQSADLVDQVKIRNQLLHAQTGLAGAQSATEGARADQIAVAAMRARLDYQWASETLPNRIKMVEQELRRTGIQASKGEIENQLLRLQKPEAEAGAAFFTGAGKYSPYVNSALDIVRTLMPKVTVGGKTPPPSRRQIRK